MEQNKIRTYILYAIGEIFLVVIGILIALQVNNWNEERKDRNYEQQTILEIRNSLQADLNFFNGLIERLDTKDQAIQTLLDLSKLNEEELEAEGFDKRLLPQSAYGITLSYDIGPYEGLKSAGLNKITNDSLRKSVIRLYEVWLPRGSAFINKISEEGDTKIKPLWSQIKEEGLIISELVKNDNGVWELVENPLDDIIKSPLFLEKLKLEMQKSRDYRVKLEPTIKITEDLAMQIDRQLN